MKNEFNLIYKTVEDCTKIIESSNDTKYFITKRTDSFETNAAQGSSYIQNLKQTILRQTVKVDRHI